MTSELSEKDETWVQRRTESVIERTPDVVRALFEIEHKKTDKATFREFWEREFRAERVAWLKAEASKAEARRQLQAAIDRTVQAEVSELFNKNYFIARNGERLAKPVLKCESCGFVLDTAGTFHALWERRQAALASETKADGLPYELQSQGVCPKCKVATGNCVFLVVP